MNIIIKQRNYADDDTELIQYQILSADSPITQNIPEEFSPAEGGYSNVGGVFKNFRKNQAKRQARKDIRVKSKAQARVQKTGAKLQQAAAQRDAAKAIGQSGKGDVELAKALSKTSKPEKSNMTRNLVIVGVAIVVIIGGVIAYKKFKKK